MNSILVSYDLRGQNKNYDELIERLNDYPVCLKINKSTWLINTSFDCTNVRNELMSFMDSDDSLFVAKLAGSAAWLNADSGTEDIKKAL